MRLRARILTVPGACVSLLCVKVFLAALVAVPVLAAAALYALFALWGDGLPVPQTMEELQPSVRSVARDRYGKPIGAYFVEDRSPVHLSRLPSHLVEAVLSSEDGRFYDHWGVNLMAIGRATLSNLRAMGVTQGASTITQQLARNLFLDQSRTIQRKIKEAILAIRLERSFSKDEILGLYLNRIYFGDGAYGVQAAARRYYGKDVEDLDLVESAMIAGIPANPTLFSPTRNPEAARGRRNRVLRRMLESGFIDRNTYRSAVEEPLNVAPSRSVSGEAPYFLEYVRLLMVDHYGTEGVYHGGLQITTTLDADLQQAAEKAIYTHLRAIEEELQYRTTYDSYRAMSTGEGAAKTPYLQAALIALEPSSGHILAMVGGRSWQDSRWNRAVQARLQPGSAFKPFVYGLALQNGFHPNDIIIDAPVRYPGVRRDSSDVWQPRNFKGTYSGPVTLRAALARSINIPSVKLLDRLGPGHLVDFVRRLGLRGSIPPYLSIALGTPEVTPLEMASAYGAFANHGIHIAPTAVIRVEDRFGRLLEESRPEPTEALGEESSAILVSMLESVFEWGTASPARTKMGLLSPAAGKTGTTDDYTDAWFVGFVPRCVCAVWVGFDEKRSIGHNMTGGRAALPIWVDFMKEFVARYGEGEFLPPGGIVTVATCEESGRLAGPHCHAIRDLFHAGSEPRDICRIHGYAREGADAEDAPPEEGW